MPTQAAMDAQSKRNLKRCPRRQYDQLPAEHARGRDRPPAGTGRR